MSPHQKAYKKYLSLKLDETINYEKFCMISIVWHSTKIEGCKLTETDTRVLLEDDLVAGGKPLYDHLMVKDHFEAFQFIKTQAVQKRKLSVNFIQEVGAKVMKSTGSVTNTALGSFNTSKGDLRLAQVYVDQKYFPDYQKVPQLLKQLCQEVNKRLDTVKNNEEIIHLAADLHYNFVNIHPFGDGNGRVARLLMNYIQLYHQEPLVKIFTEDRTAYIDALNETEAKEELQVFRDFVVRQQTKFFEEEIKKYSDMNQKGFMMMF